MVSLRNLPTPEAAIAVILHGPDHAVGNLLESVRQAGPRARPLLEDLARHKDPVVRGWALSAVASAIGSAGVDLIMAHAKGDRDADVRDIAIELLLEMDRDAVRRMLAPALRRKLRSKDLHVPVTAMWALAAIDDRSSMDAIRAIADNAEIGFHRKVAGVVCMILQGRSDEILDAIHHHDHERMPWLTKAARIVGTREARRVLEQCAEAPIDDECRNWCRKEAEYLARQQGTTPGRRVGESTDLS